MILISSSEIIDCGVVMKNGDRRGRGMDNYTNRLPQRKEKTERGKEREKETEK